MKPFKTIAIAALAASVGTIAVTAVQADGFGWGKGHHAGRMGGDFGPGFGPQGKGGRKGAKKMFERFDLNEDGSITQTELDEAVAKRFAESDTDGNGSISLAELKAAFAENTKDRQVRAFQRLDADGDGTVTRAEFDAFGERVFSRLDRDGNGELERVSGPRRDRSGPRGWSGDDGDDGDGNGQARRSNDSERAERQAQNRQGREGGEGREHRRHGVGGGPRGGMMRALFQQFDADGNGKITREEFDTTRGQLFASADTNASGGFSLTDFSTIWMTLHDQQAVRMFQRLDADGDLSVTAEEHAARTTNMVARMDRNGDGVITEADFKRGKHGKMGKHREDGDHRRGQRG